MWLGLATIMARSRKPVKMEPAILRFQIPLPTLSVGTPTSQSYIDLSQVASLINRRFYRQGINWVVSGFKHVANTSDGSAMNQGAVTISKLPDTWVMHNAFTKSKAAWLRMIDEATDESGAESIKGKFLDFKIYADAGHHTAGFGANLLPTGLSGATYTAGQWQPSELQIPNGLTTETREMLATGANLPGVGASGFNAVSLIQGYAESRALPSQEDPNLPDDANTNWMLKLFDRSSGQDQDVISDLEVTGINPPYPFEDDVAGTAVTMYPNGATQCAGLHIHDVAYITGTTVGGTQYMQGGTFPCGLIRVDTAGLGLAEGVDLYQGLFIDLVPGNHRGYLCEEM